MSTVMIPRATNERVKLAHSAHTYRVFTDGSWRRWPPKLRGKAARKADKRARRKAS